MYVKKKSMWNYVYIYALKDKWISNEYIPFDYRLINQGCKLTRSLICKSDAVTST